MSATRIIELPPALCPPNGAAIAALIQRNLQSDALAQLWLGKNYALTGDPATSYSLLQSYSGFAAHGILTADYTDQTLCIDTRILASVKLDGPDQILDDVSDLDMLAGAYIVVIDDEILFLGQSRMNGATYNLSLVRGQFGTPTQYHDAGADVFILKAKDFIAIPLAVRVGNTGQFKITVGGFSLADVDEMDVVFTGTSSTPGQITGLTMNGALDNVPYDATHDFAITWQLPDVPGVDLSKSYTLLEFIVVSVVVYSVKVAWPATSLTYTYPTTHPAALTLRASFVIFNGWETIQGQTVQLYAYQASSS